MLNIEYWVFRLEGLNWSKIVNSIALAPSVFPNYEGLSSLELVDRLLVRVLIALRPSYGLVLTVLGTFAVVKWR